MRLLTFFALFWAIQSSAQVGVNATGNPPDPSSMLDVSSSDKGVLLSRMTEAQRDNIASPAFGLLVFNTTTNCLNIWVGSWRELCGDCTFDAPQASSNAPVCIGSTLNLFATTIPGAIYSWTGPDGFTSSDQNPVIANISALNAGLYTVTATVDGCTADASSTMVTINPTPANPGAIVGTAELCENAAAVAYSVSAYPGALSYNWTVPSGATIVNGLGTNSILVTFGSSSGNVTVAAVNACGAGESSSFAVTVYPYPAVTYTTSTPVTNTPVTFTPTAAGGTYVWGFNSGSPSTSTQESPSITWTSGGTYDVSLSVTVNGCQSNASSSITIVGGPFNFSNCGQSGRNGPSQGQCDASYALTQLDGDVTVTAGIQYWTVPATGTYRIEAFGARSGYDNSGGSGDVGLGARMRGDFALTQGQVLKILVGQIGANNGSSSAGGGGGTFIATSDNTALLVAGGGGALEGSGGPFANQHGSVSTSGNPGTNGGNFAGGTACNGATQDDADNHGGGGAGFCTDGVGVGNGGFHFTPARSFLNGGTGGEPYNNNVFGGFGGGGGAWGNGGGSGGGGGYSGGGSGDNTSSGAAGGGGSFNSGSNQSNSAGVNNSNGSVSISYLGL
jgi:hypothetical protein